MRKAYFQMHFAILLWGFTAILGKAISLDEGLLVWYRMLLSTIATLTFLIITNKIRFLSAGEFVKIACIGGVVALHWVTFYGAIKSSNVSVAISCFSSVALFTALLDPLINKKLPKKAELLLSAGVIIGILIIFSEQHYYYKGIILSLVSAFLASLFTILNKNISTKYDPAIITLYELGTGFLMLTALLPFWLHFNKSVFVLPGTKDLLLLLILSVFCTTLAFTLSLSALKKLDAFTMNLSVNLEPLYSIILAILIFNEHKMLSAGFYIGSFVILSAVALHGLIKIKQLKSSGN